MSKALTEAPNTLEGKIKSFPITIKEKKDKREHEGGMAWAAGSPGQAGSPQKSSSPREAAAELDPW